MITITWKCDRCGKEECKNSGEGNPVDFWAVAVTVRTLAITPSQPARTIEQHWCRMCVEAMHLASPVRHTEQKLERSQIPPTFEDLVREIVKDELANA